mmetsp:Transcript_2508/g.7143  ORF Transcript_2508/g.7143 Transcript_2508/m.7143 type:complete len:221 (+) Transcript_2508:492-1154(+)
MATILSARRTVDKRCATTIHVTPAPAAPSRPSNACWTARSASTSKELVASSKTRQGASLRIARAIVSRCFCPPDNRDPRGPTFVRKPSGSLCTKSHASARMHASAILSSISAGPKWLAPSSSSKAKSKLSCTEALNNTGSCVTTAILRRRRRTSWCRTSTPLTKTPPPVTSYSRCNSKVTVLLPLPVFPTNAVNSPCLATKLSLRSTRWSSVVALAAVPG